MVSTRKEQSFLPTPVGHFPPFIVAMQDAGFYPHPVNEVLVLQTHISYVVLAGDYAYKLKKAVNLGILDYGSLEKRHHCCREELRLNGRFAPQIYLDIQAIVATSSGFRLASEDTAGAIEYCIRMRRFDQQCLFSRMLERGELSQTLVERLAIKLVRFHADAVVQKTSLRRLRGVIESTLSLASPYLSQLEGEAAFGEINRFCTGFLSEQTEVLAKRRREDHIRECHGDLHLNNIVLFDGAPVIFDGIEFNEDLRCTDVMAEIAFPVMDLEARGRPDLANILLNTYLEESGDWEGVAVLPLYLVYRATVRGWVHAKLADEPGLSDCEREDALSRARQYFRLAGRYTRPTDLQAWTMHGLSGAGKSTVARAVCRAHGAIHLRSDAVRKHLAGVALHIHQTVPENAGIYAPSMTRTTYTRLLELAEVCLRAGFSVVLDARYPLHRQRSQVMVLGRRLGVPVTILACLCPWPLLKRRLAARIGDISDAGPTLLEQQVQELEPPLGDELGATQFIDTTEAPEQLPTKTSHSLL